MKIARNASEVPSAVGAARREAAASFGDDRLLLERLVARPRHLEVQVMADSHGSVVHLAERDCSVQRRHQKVIEESPGPGVSEEFRAALGRAAVAAAEAVRYEGAGTVEFIVDEGASAAAASSRPSSSSLPDFFFMVRRFAFFRCWWRQRKKERTKERKERKNEKLKNHTFSFFLLKKKKKNQKLKN